MLFTKRISIHSILIKVIQFLENIKNGDLNRLLLVNSYS